MTTSITRAWTTGPTVEAGLDDRAAWADGAGPRADR